MWSPHDGQREFLASRARIRVLACGRRWGKTAACAAQIVDSLLGETPSRHLVLAPTLDQARLLFDRVEELLNQVLDREGSAERPKTRQTPYPRLEYGVHSVIARSGHQGKNLRGHEATHIIVDEAAFVPEALIHEVAMPMLATTGGHLTLISTPNGRNHFWRFFQLGQNGHPAVWCRQAPSEENPLVGADFLWLQRELISDRAYRVEYGAEFMESAGQVFKAEDIEACLGGEPPAEPAPPFFVGIDWARYTDFTAVCVLSGTRRGARLVEAVQIPHQSWPAQVERIRQILSLYPRAHVCCDGTGVGDAAVSMLADAMPGYLIESEVFTSKLKQELIEGLQILLEYRCLKMPPHPELVKELSHFEADVSSGRTKLGAQPGYHDDLVTALALAARLLPGSPPPRPILGARRAFSRLRRWVRTQAIRMS